jgi:hypothetical protein
MKKTFVISLLLTAIVALAPMQAVSAMRYVGLRVDDTEVLRLKEGAYNVPWENIADSSTIYDVSVTDSRISYIDGMQNLWVKEGPKTASWQLVATNANFAKVIGDKIYFVDNSLRLYGKQGAIGAPWQLLKTNVYDIEASGNRLAVFSDFDGVTMELYVKEGGMSAAWADLATVNCIGSGGMAFVPTAAVTDTRVAIIPSNFSSLSVKEGGLQSQWVPNVWSGYILNAKMDGNRLCVSAVVSSSPNVYCKDGALAGSWVKVYDGALLNDVQQDKISITALFVNVKVLEGTLAQNSGWQTMDDGGWAMYFSH